MSNGRRLAMWLAYYNAAFNLLLFALNPAWGSIVLAWVCMLAGAYFTAGLRIERRRKRATQREHAFLMRPQPRLPDPFRWAGSNTIVLEPGERVIPMPARPACTHWPRDEVKLSDGATVAYICRACGHDWADEKWVRALT